MSTLTAEPRKTATDVPASIGTPDRVDTRLGTLRFFDGLPDAATVEKLYDNLDFQRAVQAYLLAVPAVSQVAMRKAIESWGPANATLLIWEHMVTPRTILLTANNNTPYSLMWIDLTDGPLVVEVPPKVLGFINDTWAHWVADVGLTGADTGAGGTYLLVPPGFAGEVPEGPYVVRPRTNGMYVAWRSFLDETGDPKPHVDLIKATTRVYPLAHPDRAAELRFVDVTDEPFCAVAPTGFAAWTYLDEAVQAEPPDSLDPVTLGLYRAIGIEKGRSFAPDERMRAILEEAAAVGEATARALSYRLREEDAYYYEDSAWRSLFVGGYDQMKDGALVLDAYTQLYFLGTGISPAEEQKLVGRGSQYAMAMVDAHGEYLDGGESYRLHLPAGIPAKDFWSVLVYDAQTRSMLQTDQPYPSLSSQNPDVAVNPDTSVDVYFGPKPPRGKASNWVQTLPGKGWWLMLRLYGPLEPWFDKTWRPGEIERLAGDR